MADFIYKIVDIFSNKKDESINEEIELRNQVRSAITERRYVSDGLSPDQRKEYHKAFTHKYYSKKERRIISMVRNHILAGGSLLKAPLEANEITMIDIIDGIKDNRCIGTTKYDIGHTQARNTIGNVIHDIFGNGYQMPGSKDITTVNDARAVFGLKPITR